MWFYTSMLLLPPALVAIWIWWCRCRGKVQVRRWAWPVLLASIPLSFPWLMILALNCVIEWLRSPAYAFESIRPALWLSGVLYCCLWLQIFTWVLGLFIVLGWNGMVFASLRAGFRFLASVGAIMAYPCLYNAAFLALLFFLTPILSREVAEAASPDGRLLVRVYEYPGMSGVSYDVMCETNDWCPLIAMNLGTVYEFEERSKQRLVWSQDSQVLELCSDNIPSRAYLLLPKFRFKSAGVPSVAQRTEIDRLMTEHGGPAP